MAITKSPWVCRPIQSYQEPGYAVFWQDTSKPGVHSRRLDYKGCFTEADARLIAAAPELLEALQECADFIDITVSHLVDGTKEANKAYAAIAKATEGQPC